MERKKIGIAVSTRNRAEQLEWTMMNIYNYTMFSCPIVIVDDASDNEPISVKNNYKFTERVGIPRVKNKCIEMLYNSGCEHFFLFDDDTYPIKKDWHLPYIESPYEHLSYTFLNPYKTVDNHNFYKPHGNGCMMYFTRNVVDTIGGFDPNFGLGKYEHLQFSHRVHNFGLIPEPFIDVLGSNEYIYCEDQNNNIARSFSKQEDRELRGQNSLYFVTHKKEKLKINFVI